MKSILILGLVLTLNAWGQAPQTNSAAGKRRAVLSFVAPQSLAVDGAGNVFVTDARGIHQIAPSGVVTNLALARIPMRPPDFDPPLGVAVDDAGNLFVAHTVGNTILKLTAAGAITTLAGAEASGYADGAGVAARFNYPRGLAVDPAGNVCVADTRNHVIRVVTPAGVVTTLAGSPGHAGSADGSGGAARFSAPRGVAIGRGGIVFVADTDNHTIRRVTPSGRVLTLAGSPGLAGSADGKGTAARFSGPRSVAVDHAGNVFVADTLNSTIRKVTPDGVVTTLAGGASSGPADGTGSAAWFRGPKGVAVDPAGNVFVADTYFSRIRKVTPEGVVTTLGAAP